MTREGAFIVYSYNTRREAYLLSEKELKERMELVLVKRARDGAIYAIRH